MTKFKNEENIKDKIFEGHRRGVCDSSGRSIKVTNSAGKKVFIAKPRFGTSSVVKRYVYRKGRMVLKNG
jgi:hypothetical protein